MSLLLECRAALGDPNVQAFLRVIRAGEGTSDEAGYRRHFGGELFDSFDKHPGKAVTRALGSRTLTSTAAGAYQFLSGTWAECQQALGLPDFSPPMQDLAAVFLIRRRGALDDVIAGRLDAAIAGCAKEWASLPGSPYGQPTRTMAQCRAVYEAAGGRYEPVSAPAQPPAPENAATATPATAPAPWRQSDDPAQYSPEIGMPIPAAASFLWGLASSAIEVFSPLAREKIAREVARHTDKPEIAEQVANSVIETAKALTGKSDPVAAVAAAKVAPAIVQQMESDTLAALDRLMPVLERLATWDQAAWAAEEESRRNADERARGAEKDQDEFLTRSIIALFVGLMLSLAVLIGVLIKIGADAGTVGTLVGLFAAAGGAIVGALNTRMQHRYGSSRGSAAKDVLAAELARRPKVAP